MDINTKMPIEINNQEKYRVIYKDSCLQLMAPDFTLSVMPKLYLISIIKSKTIKRNTHFLNCISYIPNKDVKCIHPKSTRYIQIHKKPPIDTGPSNYYLHKSNYLWY